jgi:DNA polymerase-3 subunit gamma/tau
VRYPPQNGKKKVYIIDEVHMLSNQAFNAFLKTLEEPPSYAIFILATTEKHKIIPTILSRCQIFDFNRITVRDISTHLSQIAEKEGIKAEAEALHLVAQKADGALRDALSLFDLMVTYSTDRNVTYAQVVENLHILDYDYFFKIVDAMLAQQLSDLFLIFDEILKKGFDGHNFLIGLAEHLRNLLISKEPATISLLDVPENIKNKFLEQSTRNSPSFLLTALSILSDAETNYKSSKSQRLLVELTLMKIAHIPSAISLSVLVEDLKKKTELRANTPISTQAQATSTQSPVQNANTVQQYQVKTTPKINLTGAPPAKIEEKITKVEEKRQDVVPAKIINDNVEVLRIVQSFFVQEDDFLQKYATNDLQISRDGKMIFSIENSLEEGFIRNKREVLLRFVKEQTGRVFELAFEMKKTQENKIIKRLDTNAAKIEHLTENNALLADFIKALGLEPE